MKSGTAYAAIVIPPTFSADLLTITTGDFVQPELDYYVNEKAGPVAPKITDTGVNTLDETINSTFVSTVTGVVASNIDTASAQAEQRMDGSKRGALGKIDDAAAKVGALRDSLSELREAGESASAKAEEARGALTEAKGADRGVLGGPFDRGRAREEVIDEGVNVFSANLADVSVRSLSLLAELSNDYETAQKDVREGLGRADGALADALEEGRGIVESERKLLDEADALLAELPEDSAAKEPLADLIERRRVQAELLSQQVEALDESRTAAGEALGALDGAGEQSPRPRRGPLRPCSRPPRRSTARRCPG